jgi:hypothetical protein
MAAGFLSVKTIILYLISPDSNNVEKGEGIATGNYGNSTGCKW